MDKFMKWVIRASIIFSLIYTFKTNHWIGTVGGLIVFIITFFVDYLNLKYLKINKTIIAIVYFYCIFSLVLGSMWNFYDNIEWWDILMHILSGVILGIIGSLIFDNYSHKSKTSNSIRFLFVLGIACTGGILWEMYEFTVDTLFKLDTQLSSVSGVRDTMWDLITDFLGGLIAGFYFIKIKKN